MERAVLLIGYYGFGNTGDEAILAALVAGLRARNPEARIRVASGDPGLTRQQHGVDAVFWRDPLSLAEAVRGSDLVVVGGGGLFQDYAGVESGTLLTPRHGGVAYYAAPSVLAAVARKPVALHALGVGPLLSEEARRLVATVAKAAVRVSVRDEGSRALLETLGVPGDSVTVTADPAFLLDAERIRPEDVLIGMGIEPQAPIVGVALRPWARGVDPAAWEAAVARALDRFLESTRGTLLFVPFEKSPWSEDDDFAIAARVRRRLTRPLDRTAVLSGLLAPADTASLLGGCDVVLAMRLHAAVFALGAGVPAVGLAYDPKVEALLSKSGLDELVEPIAGLSAESLGRRLNLAHGERERWSTAAAATSRERRVAAERDLDALAALLADPPEAPPVSADMLALVEEGLSANLQRTHELSAAVDVLRADRTGQELKIGDLESRLTDAESIEANLRATNAELLARVDQSARERVQEVGLLEVQRAEAREELYRIQTSRLWKTVNVYWRARRVAARLTKPARHRVATLLGGAPADWVGPDPARAAAAAAMPGAENCCEIVLLPASAAPEEAALAASEAGHRVFAVEPELRRHGPPYTVTGRGPRLFSVSLCASSFDSDEIFESLDRLRREQALGATLAVAEPPFRAAAERLSAERAWQRTDSLGDPDAIAAAFPKLSVIVVTWNGRDVNRLCFESVLARTEWPNLEVIAVDNGSGDGTRELLEALSLRDPRVRPILLDGNRGFAAACNAGLAESSGDFLVILNNDTVVPRGWASALVRHLAADPKLGLVGPVTNAIANAARIPVGYGEVGEMPAWAAEWMRAHDGETFDIPMLALFCTALRRRVYEEVGPLDERFGIGLFEDDDYNRRVREKGFSIRCARDAFVHHWQMASFRRLGQAEYYALYAENKRRYEEKWSAPPETAPVAAPVPTRRFATLEEHRTQLSHVLQRAAGAKGVVVFLPSVGWGIHLFQRPHHLARVFARLGHVAIFDSSNAADRVDGFREIEPNLFLFSGAPELLHELPSPVLWAFPYNYHLADGFPAPRRTVYDWIDDLSVFPHDPALLEKNHARALAEASLVACVARRLHEEAKEARPDALYLPNGVEYERFAAPAAPPRDEVALSFLAPGAPVAGYYGALAEWFDYDLLAGVADAKPDWRFLLIGPQYDASLPGQPLLERPNVKWIGPRDYVTLPGYLSLFDVATIPFRINAITQATSPLKLYEYFAGARPVVTTPMSECRAHPEVRIAGSVEEFVRALDEAREQGRDPDFRAHLRSVARENSWSARVMAALRALDPR